MALYFHFNETTGDLVYSDQDTYDVEGYTSLGQQTYTNPTVKSRWVFNSQRASIKTVTKDPNISGPINVLTGMDYMFDSCTALTSLDLSGFDTSNVISMSQMFYSCSVLTSLDLSGFDTSNVTIMDRMFSGCKALTSLDLSGFDTSNVTTVDYMFNGCHALTSLDVSSFDTSNVRTMLSVFINCNALRIIDISPNMSNILSKLPAAIYYDAVTRQSYAKANIPGGSTYVRNLADLDLIATMVQTRMGINVAKRLAHKAMKMAGSTVVSMNNVDVVRTTAHRTDYDRDTLEVVTDSTDKVTAMYLINAR